MRVKKRNGEYEEVTFDAITSRIKKLCTIIYLPVEYINTDSSKRKIGDRLAIDPIEITQKVSASLYDGITTTELDELSASIAESMCLIHPDYGILASNIIIDNNHKSTTEKFSRVLSLCFTNGLISESVHTFVNENSGFFDNAINYTRDFMFDYFGYKTLERSYLLKVNDKIVERPQHMLMRESIICNLATKNLENIKKTYDIISAGYYTHATPTLFNACSPRNQLASCFLLSMEDSIQGILKTHSDCGLISKWAGGIGLSIHNIRAKGSKIRGTNGQSTGIVPMLKLFNETANYINQGGKRNGSFAIYLEPYHADIFDFINLRKSDGDPSARAKDLFYALWIPDLFMRKIKGSMEYHNLLQQDPTSPLLDSLRENLDWYLMCPDQSPGLPNVYGQEFEDLYNHYVRTNNYIRKINILELWEQILHAQTETGTPYMLYKDACNIKSNQKNLGTIRSSNLCSEIIEYTDSKNISVCNLASIALPRFVSPSGIFDFQKLYEVTRLVTRNLNEIIDINFYPVPETEYSNLNHRPIGIGVQGLADVFIRLRYPFESQEAAQLNIQIFETIYFAFLSESNDLAKQFGVYNTYKNSPIDHGILQPDMWDYDTSKSTLWNWSELREKIKLYGIRNSLGIALMPTASTSQILGNFEAFEPIKYNIYTRRTLSGNFYVINKYLIHDLLSFGLWNSDMKNKILANDGSVQNISEIPKVIRDLYKTAWEIKQRTIIDLAAGRGPFIDQSQSMNLFVARPSFNLLTSIHLHAWESGLKTGMYYLRSSPASDAIKFTVDPKFTKQLSEPDTKPKKLVSDPPSNGSEFCTMQEGCVICSS